MPVTSVNQNPAAKLAHTSSSPTTTPFHKVMGHYYPSPQSCAQSTHPPEKQNWQHFSNVPPKWCHSEMHLKKWAGNNHAPRYKSTTQQPSVTSITPSLHDASNHWRCDSIGSNAERVKASSASSGTKVVTTWPITTLNITHLNITSHIDIHMQDDSTSSKHNHSRVFLIPLILFFIFLQL